MTKRNQWQSDIMDALGDADSREQWERGIEVLDEMAKQLAFTASIGSETFTPIELKMFWNCAAIASWCNLLLKEALDQNDKLADLEVRIFELEQGRKKNAS